MKRALVSLVVFSTLVAACGRVGGSSGPAGRSSTAATPNAESPVPSDTSGLPAIVVETPRTGETVSSPVTISGTADVFEATVSILILDTDGKVKKRTFTTATCGTGCRGTFSADVAYHVDSEQPGTIRVFESSAEDGSSIHVVSIPVTLTP